MRGTFRFQISEFRFQVIFPFRFQISDFRNFTSRSDFRFQISEISRVVQISDFRNSDPLFRYNPDIYNCTRVPHEKSRKSVGYLFGFQTLPSSPGTCTP